jgi:hypothetical protein
MFFACGDIVFNRKRLSAELASDRGALHDCCNLSLLGKDVKP